MPLLRGHRKKGALLERPFLCGHCDSRYQTIPLTKASRTIQRARRNRRNRIGGRLSWAAGGKMRAPRVVAMLAGGLRAEPSAPPEPICGVARRSATLVLRNELPVR